MVPTIAQCFSLMEKYEMLEHIKEHSVKVAIIAKFIGSNLINTGSNISIEKIIAGALLHDIAKTECIGSRKDHSRLGMEICNKEGLDEIADIVGEHVVLKNFSALGAYYEKEVVFYSDKRVLHVNVVSLDARFKDLIIRYARDNKKLEEMIIDNYELCKKLEEKIFNNLCFYPKDISFLIKDIVYIE